MKGRIKTYEEFNKINSDAFMVVFDRFSLSHEFILVERITPCSLLTLYSKKMILGFIENGFIYHDKESAMKKVNTIKSILEL